MEQTLSNEQIHEAVGLLMTYRCNLHCTYCYIHNKKDNNMSLERAKEILAPLLNSGNGLLDITFMGGETILAMNVIRPLTEWIESHKWVRRFRLFGATNGTLLTEELKKWFEKRCDYFTLALSFDGLPSTQQINRGSNCIDLDFFIKTWPNQPIQMTINNASVSKMAEGVMYLLKKGAIVHPNVAFEEYEWTLRDINEYGKQLDILAEYYSNHTEFPVIIQFEHDIISYANNLDNHYPQLEVCGAGNGFKVYDVDGKVYPCHLLSPLVLDKEKLELINTSIIEQTDNFEDPRCSKCPYTSNCPTCLGCNLKYRNDLCKRDSTHCRIMRMEVRSFLKKEIKRLKNKNSLNSTDATLFDSIKKIYNYEKKHSL